MPFVSDASLSRRRFLRSVAVTAGALSIGSLLSAPALAAAAPVAAVTPLNVQLLWIKNVEFGGYWVADDQGMYTQEGVAPTFLAGGPGANPENVVAGGSADVGLTGGL